MKTSPSILDLIKPKHILWAIHRCCNGVRWKASIQRFELNALRWTATIRKDMRKGKYRSRGFCSFFIMERGKLRHIQSVHISERTVQKLLCEYALKPVVIPQLIYDNSASQEGKGTEFALKRLKEHLRWHYARYGKSGAILVMDYHDFFNSIPHEGAIQAMTKGQDDPIIRKYIGDFVNCYDGDKGLGLGSETSQIAAICFPNEIDKFIKEELKIHCNARYMDDSYIIHPDRKYVEYCLGEIIKRAEAKGLEINLRKTKIHNLATDDFVFLKKRIHLTDTGKIIMRLSRENIRLEKERILEMRSEYYAGVMTLEGILQSYASWRGNAQKYDGHETVRKMDTYFVSVMGKILDPVRAMGPLKLGHPPISELMKRSRKRHSL